jgi:hypothetical protein
LASFTEPSSTVPRVHRFNFSSSPVSCNPRCCRVLSPPPHHRRGVFPTRFDFRFDLSISFTATTTSTTPFHRLVDGFLTRRCPTLHSKLPALRWTSLRPPLPSPSPPMASPIDLSATYTRPSLVDGFLLYRCPTRHSYISATLSDHPAATAVTVTTSAVTTSLVCTSHLLRLISRAVKCRHHSTTTLDGLCRPRSTTARHS